MNPEQENFDALRRLMKIKRYEQPPPRYFKDFSSQVLARIEREEITPSSASWLDKFADLFQARPAFSGVLGAAVCLLLVGTAVYSEAGGPQGASNPFNNLSPELAANPQDETSVSSTTTNTSLFSKFKVQPAVPVTLEF